MEQLLKKISRAYFWWLAAAVAVLSLQTRFIWFLPEHLGHPIEYGTGSVYLFDVFLLCFFIHWGIFYSVHRQNPEQTQHVEFSYSVRRILILLSYVLIFAGITLIWADNVQSGFIFWCRLLAGFAFLVAILAHTHKKMLLLYSFLAGATLQAWWSIGQFFMQFQPANKYLGVSVLDPAERGVSVIEYFKYIPQLQEVVGHRVLRAYGGLPHPNVLGGFMLITLVLAIYLYYQTEQKKAQLFLLIAQISTFLALLVSFSRSAWLAGVIVLSYVIFTLKKQAIFNKITLYLSAILLVISLLLWPLFATRLGFATQTDSSLTRLEQLSLEERGNLIHDWRTITQKSPFLGTGIGNYIPALQQEYPGRPWYALQPVHNVFLLILAEFGLFGMVFLFFAGVGYILYLKNAALHKKLLILAIFIITLFDHYWYTLHAPFFLLTLVSAYTLFENHKNPNTT
jgi:hypothetical protein